MNILNPDIVRETALKIIAKNPDGIKQSELFRQTDYELRQLGFIPDNNIIKNSLWNLQVTREPYVSKYRLSNRNVVLVPKDLLVREVEGEYDYGGEDYENSVYTAETSLYSLTRDLKEIVAKVERGGILISLEIAMSFISEYNTSEMSAIFGIKENLEGIKRHFNTLRKEFPDL